MQVQQKTIDISQFSEADWKRLTDYVALLIKIDCKMRKNESSSWENKNEH